jgi:hypothetical protein
MPRAATSRFINQDAMSAFHPLRPFAAMADLSRMRSRADGLLSAILSHRLSAGMSGHIEGVAAIGTRTIAAVFRWGHNSGHRFSRLNYGLLIQSLVLRVRVLSWHHSAAKGASHSLDPFGGRAGEGICPDRCGAQKCASRRPPSAARISSTA